MSEQELQAMALRYKFIYAMAGLCLGLVCTLAGTVLFLRGVVGSTSWSARFLGSQGTLTDAAPGGILFVVGLFIVFLTRYRVRMESGVEHGRKWTLLRLFKPL